MDRLKMSSRYKGFHNVSEIELTPLNYGPSRTRTHRLTSIAPKHLSKYVFLALGFLWNAPIIALLVLNFKGYTVGPSAWCPRGHCSFNQFGNDTFEQMKRLNKDDHNTLGMLQFVAKALEVWFAVVATGLVYNIAMLLARGRGGLPIGHFMTHVDFKDLTYLVDPVTWKSPIPIHEHSTARPATVKTFLFVLFAAFMCIIANLMGPAVAVLLIPNLQWKDTSHIPHQVFVGIDSATLQLHGSPSRVCTPAQLVARNYSCTADTYASSLDSWADITLATDEQLNYFPSISDSTWGLSEEAAVSFTLNITNGKDNDYYINWSPNREVLQDISADYYTHFIDPASNNSLKTILTREGPILGTIQATYTTNNTTVVTFANTDPSEKSIRCYINVNYLSLDLSQPLAKCIRVGKLWNSTNSVASFSISSTNNASNAIAADIYFSDKATYFTGALSSCLADGQAPDGDTCDWDAIFSPNLTDRLPDFTPSLLHFLNTTARNIITVEMRLSDSLQGTGRLNTESAAFSSIATYLLDTSPTSIGMIQVDGLGDPTEETSLVANADWILAAWSVDNNSTLEQNRSSTIVLCDTVKTLLWDMEYNTTINSTQQYTQLDAGIQLVEISIAQAMSMMGYNNNNTSFSTANPNSILHSWAQIYVWTYGLSSRTAILGITVTIIGILCVILQVVLSCLTKTFRPPSTDELVGAALAHEPDSKFDNHGKRMSKIRMKIHEEEDGKLRFEPLVKSPVIVGQRPQYNASMVSFDSTVISPEMHTSESRYSDTAYTGA